MKLSVLFGKTQRETPAEAETASHALMLKAGMIHQLTAGVYCYLPLAWRVLRKIEQIIREEMDRAGGQELLLPALQPLEMWRESGREAAFGANLFRLRDRRDRELCIAPTHEEVITDLVRRNVRSYRDLPLILYQIQTKFRDEPRPRGGLIRVREFTMKDAYSFDPDPDGLDASYWAMYRAYERIYQRCGLTALAVEADSGAIGGKDSHEFMLIAQSGEDVVVHCPHCRYAANQERATFRKEGLPPEPPLPLEEVATPGIKTIETLARFLHMATAQTLKAVFYSCDGEVVFVVIRGDLDVNEIKLTNTLKCRDLRLATDEDVARVGLVAGSASPVGLKGIRVIADESITLGHNFVAGANKPDTHLKNVNYPRDFSVDLMVDIAKAQEGFRCLNCAQPLAMTRGIEVGHVFKLGTVYSEKLGATYLDRDGQQKAIYMGCYGIGTGRLMAAAIEQNHDAKGIIWPESIAPYRVHLTALSVDQPAVAEAANRLYEQLRAAGCEVLYDDRVESPGVKFNDADLLGIPLRITVSPRTLKSESVELKRRRSPETMLVPLDEAAGRVMSDE
ncbi:MAG: proline--tRNA ligase [Chloroflexi bacterium]|nr:proline--tRNA ligase [Chloroflexota bacterium]